MPPSAPDLEYTTDTPTDPELRSLRRLVKGNLDGQVLSGIHGGRKTRIKQAPGKFKSVNVPLTGCGHEDVICDLPVEREDGYISIMRVCLVCDAGREMLGLPG